MVMFFRSSAREISTTTSGPWAVNFRSARRSVPPAIILTLALAACWARSVTAWFESFAAKNSNDFIYLSSPSAGGDLSRVLALAHLRLAGRNGVSLKYHFRIRLAIARWIRDLQPHAINFVSRLACRPVYIFQMVRYRSVTRLSSSP